MSVHRKTCKQIPMTVLLITAQNWEQPECLSINRLRFTNYMTFQNGLLFMGLQRFIHGLAGEQHHHKCFIMQCTLFLCDFFGSLLLF